MRTEYYATCAMYLSRMEAGLHGGGTMEICRRLDNHVERVMGRIEDIALHSSGCVAFILNVRCNIFKTATR